jgi:exosome complex exonuclease DIS3/RRP44
MLTIAIQSDKKEEIMSDLLRDTSRMQTLCDHLNDRHRMAQRVSRASVELFTILFFKDKLLEEEAFVTRVMKNGFIVLIFK